MFCCFNQKDLNYHFIEDRMYCIFCEKGFEINNLTKKEINNICCKKCSNKNNCECACHNKNDIKHSLPCCSKCKNCGDLIKEKNLCNHCISNKNYNTF
jgi:hypothetical protein